ncbi:hypothetical protein BPT24_118 [Tenacibaculum phage pT24]|uniref:Uncharacterized protein n=1 Tax=Tenacibaculum phage pT24 TaxID=1880590 RepID=A0A1B4XWP9_9CAUD|nr:hypothetical protein HYP10_gp118 [Tenacibaculum phage pT24]BAV39243.1 hypothetical protein BPT24_118 [Tenacibaculum phage pT24]
MALEESLNTGSNRSSSIDYIFNNKDEHTIEDVYKAVVGDNETLYEITKKSDKKLDMIVSSISASNSYLASIEAHLAMGQNFDSMEAFKHGAILSVDLTAEGDAKDFMQSLTKLAELDDIQLISVANGLDNIALSLDKILEKDYSKSKPILTTIEAMVTGLVKLNESIPNFKMIGGIAAGLALLGLSIAGFTALVGFDSILLLGATFGGLALVSHLLNGVKTDLLNASFGIATMGLSIWAFTELVNPSMLFEFSASLLGLGTAIAIYDGAFGKSSMSVSKYLLQLALGVGGLGLALMPYDNVEWSSIAKASTAITGVGLAGSLLKKSNPKDALTLGALALSTGVLGLSLMSFKDIAIEDVTTALIAMTGMVGVGYLAGKLGKNSLIGALALGGIGLSMIAIAKGLDSIKGLGLTLDDAGVIAGTIGLTAGAFSALGIPVVAALIGTGAIVALSMGAGLATLSWGLNKVATVNLGVEQAQNFADSVILVKDAIAQIGESGGLTSLLSGIAQSALITGATLPLVLAVNMVNKVKAPKEETLTGFSNTVMRLKDTFTQFGFLDLAELAAVTPVMLLMATTTVALGGAINLFTKLSTTKENVDSAVSTLDSFLIGIHASFAKHDDESFDVLRKGIDSTMNLGLLLKNLSMGINEISVHMKNNTDFKGIGESVGSMLMALTDPLAQIGSQKDSISIGGFNITNPFSNKVENGIDALRNIGSVFTPLSDMVKIFANDTDGTLVQKFGTNIRGILGTLSEVFVEFQDTENQGMEFLYEATDNTSSFIKTLTGANYEGASKGLKSVSASTVVMRDSINNMDLEKLSKLNDLFHNMNMLNEGEGIEKLVEALGNFVEALMTANSSTVTNNNNETNKTTNKTEKGESKDIKPIKDMDELANVLSSGNTDIVESLRELLEYLQSGDLTATVEVKEGF